MKHCPHHPEREAVELCGGCGSQFCLYCISTRGGRALCSSCQRSSSQKRSLLAIGGLALGLITIAGVVFLALQKKDAPQLSERAQKIKTLEAKLQESPCDKGVILQLTDQLLYEARNKEVLERASAFRSRCQGFETLLWKTFEAHKRLSQNKEALADVSALIERRPTDQDYWVWRGLLHESMGSMELAANDFRQALSIEPRLTQIPFNLTNIYEHLGRPCESIFYMEQYATHNPSAWKDAKFKAHLERIYELEACKSSAGQAVINFPRGANRIVARANLNGHKMQMLVDSGASYITINDEQARKAGLKEGPRLPIQIHTAAGLRTGYLITAPVVKLQGLTAKNVPVVVLRELPGSLGGLLGLSFLSRYKMEMDRAKGTLILTGR